MESRQSVLVLPQEPIGTIQPSLHGHFAEHLGELVYPGIWVGEESAIPHTGGIRNDVIAALKPLEVPVLRWPGGCFADTYHWRDGIGPRADRPKRVNVHWGMAEESNQFGTHEFMAFCRAIGAEPYFAANLGSGAPAEMRDWVEYCNFAGASARAEERRANGDDAPFGVRYWGIGNENWACGGHMGPEEYAAAFARYRAFVYDYPGTKIEAIACGAPDSHWEWTGRFLEAIKSQGVWNRLGLVQGLAAHYYCWTAGTATEYTDSQWLELLSKAAAIEGILTGHRAVMDEYDPERKIKLLLDEWGTWHPTEPGKPGGGLYQQNTMRDACVAALTLDIFHNHAEKLAMANIAQLINVLQAVLLVEEDRCITTPTYHVFDLHKPHKGGQAVRFIAAAEAISNGEAAAEFCRNCYRDKQPFTLRAVQGSASIKGDVLCVTAVNTHPTEPIELELMLQQGRLETAEIVTLASGDIHDHNTFAQPDLVRLSAPQTVQAAGKSLTLPLAPASIIRILAKLH